DVDPPRGRIPEYERIGGSVEDRPILFFARSQRSFRARSLDFGAHARSEDLQHRLDQLEIRERLAGSDRNDSKQGTVAARKGKPRMTVGFHCREHWVVGEAF